MPPGRKRTQVEFLLLGSKSGSLDFRLGSTSAHGPTTQIGHNRSSKLSGDRHAAVRFQDTAVIVRRPFEGALSPKQSPEVVRMAREGPMGLRVVAIEGPGSGVVHQGPRGSTKDHHSGMNSFHLAGYQLGDVAKR